MNYKTNMLKNILLVASVFMSVPCIAAPNPTVFTHGIDSNAQVISPTGTNFGNLGTAINKANGAVQANGGDASKTVVTPTGGTHAQNLNDIAAQAVGSVQQADANQPNGYAKLDRNGNVTSPLLNNTRVGGSDTGTDISNALVNSAGTNDKVVNWLEKKVDVTGGTLNSPTMTGTVTVPAVTDWDSQQPVGAIDADARYVKGAARDAINSPLLYAGMNLTTGVPWTTYTDASGTSQSVDLMTTAAARGKIDVTNTNANAVNVACPIGSCPPLGSTPGPVKSAYTMQGETHIASGQGEMILNLGLLVDKGASGGAVTYGKLPLYVGMMQAAGGGSALAFNTNAIRNGVPGGENSINDLPGSGSPGAPGAMGSVSTIGYENDLTNWDEDTEKSGAFIAGYYGHMQGSYASTAYFNLDANMSTGIFGAHYGEYWQPNTVKDAVWVEDTNSGTGTLYKGRHLNATIEDDGTGNTAILLKGNKSMASILDQSKSPAALQASGAYSVATINDQSSSPAALNLSGSYTLAAINDSMPTTNNVAFVSIKGQHKVCFDGQTACMYYDNVNKKLYGTNSTGTITWSVDDSGNAIFKGTVTANAVP